MTDRETGNAARCQRWAANRRANGWVRVTVEVPADRADELREIAAQMRVPSPALPMPTADEPLPASGTSVTESWIEAERVDWIAPVPSE